MQDEDATFERLKRRSWNEIEGILELDISIKNGTKTLDYDFGKDVKNGEWGNSRYPGLRNAVTNTGWTEEQIVSELMKRYGEKK